MPKQSHCWHQIVQRQIYLQYPIETKFTAITRCLSLLHTTDRQAANQWRKKVASGNLNKYAFNNFRFPSSPLVWREYTNATRKRQQAENRNCNILPVRWQHWPLTPRNNDPISFLNAARQTGKTYTHSWQKANTEELQQHILLEI